MITIETLSNGWVLRTDPNDEEEFPLKEAYTFGDTITEAHALSNLLWAVQDLVGPPAGGYVAERVYIVVHPGDKHTDYDVDFDKFR